MTVEIKNKVVDFISNTFLVDFDTDADEEMNLFQAGFIDSFGFVELVNYLEKTFHIKITDEDLFSDALTSVAKIVDCIEGKIHAGALQY